MLDCCSLLGIWAQRQPPRDYMLKQDPYVWLKRLLSPLSLIPTLFLVNLLLSRINLKENGLQSWVLRSK